MGRDLYGPFVTMLVVGRPLAFERQGRRLLLRPCEVRATNFQALSDLQASATSPSSPPDMQ